MEFNQNLVTKLKIIGDRVGWKVFHDNDSSNILKGILFEVIFLSVPLIIQVLGRKTCTECALGYLNTLS